MINDTQYLDDKVSKTLTYCFVYYSEWETYLCYQYHFCLEFCLKKK